ncbi:hypothetical protein RCL1_007017 [Eukaryota sp. TZLM3-RCL]
MSSPEPPSIGQIALTTDRWKNSLRSQHVVPKKFQKTCRSSNDSPIIAACQSVITSFSYLRTKPDLDPMSVVHSLNHLGLVLQSSSSSFVSPSPSYSKSTFSSSKRLPSKHINHSPRKPLTSDVIECDRLERIKNAVLKQLLTES